MIRRGCISILVICLWLCIPAYVSSQTGNKLDDISKALRAASNDTEKAKLYIQLAEQYANTNYTLATENALLAVETATRIKAPAIIIEALNLAGEVHLNAGRNDLAADFFSRTIQQAKQAGDELKVATGYFNLGTIWLGVEKYDKAESIMLHAEKAFNAHAQKNKRSVDTTTLIALYNNLIIINSQKKQLDKGRFYFEKALPLAQQLDDGQRLQGMLYINFGDLLIEQEQYRESLEVYKKALNIFEHLGDKVRIAVVYSSMGVAYDLMGNPDAAMDMFTREYTLSLETDNDYLLEHAAREMAGLFKAKGQADSALYYFTIAKEAKEKLNEAEAREKLVSHELTTQFEEQQETRERRYFSIISKFALSLALALIALVLIAFFARKYRKSLYQANLEKYRLSLAAEKLQLENELLGAQVEARDKELAAKAMLDIQKNEMIGHVIDQIQSSQVLPPELLKGKVIKELEKTREASLWEEFEIRFLQVHQGFYDRLHQACPSLTPNERRLCAFLRLNMSSKEISAITGQSPNSIKVARNRLRQKLGITNADMGLVGFLAAI
jgi:tetratricopeptide (TPR) repeat protein/DNA-binding CsgD family transcriptional regulator